ncbi:DUF4214 domain-containing protein [Achromobacter sp. GG226]|uniref:DUF4214 domain-containing protein n=1 Tax=Verticiella alkaliphila TaxID=2779529 RepID=UPI001C0CF727|nr:DUF4214 domain-containing protein [Verticiella sp. GG226]MBU4612637.1 DUF4214 domain-containing protein [Verticiella sp. GG226]
MALTRAQAIAQIELFQRIYLPSRPDFVQDWIAMIDSGLQNLGRSPAETMKLITPKMIGTAGQYENAFPSHPVDMWAINNGVAYANSIDPLELVDYFYPDGVGAYRAELATALANGVITSIDFLTGWLPARMDSPRPTASHVFKEIFDAGAGDPTPPALDLALPGVTDAQTEFLIGIYVAAFNRAPEHEGLKYWAGDLARHLSNGMSEQDAMKEMAKGMYFSGAQNGESGTGLGHAAYVHFVYDTVLGRAPDAAGARYWTDKLYDGANRSEFLAVFLNSALSAAGDGDYVKGRIAVAEFLAQAHVSGPGKVIDLVGILNYIETKGDAYIAIQLLKSQYPKPADSATRLLSFSNDDDINLSAYENSAHAVESGLDIPDAQLERTITLVGISAGQDDLAF